MRAALVAPAVLAAVLGAAPLSAQVDAGPDPCDPACDGDRLMFCDGDEPAALDCRDLGGRCDVLSAAWGADCVLGAGEPCDPGYAFGLSRCDSAASLFCIDGTCTAADGGVGEPIEEPTNGTELGLTPTTSNPFGCSDCGTGQAALLVPALVLMRRLRPRRR